MSTDWLVATKVQDSLPLDELQNAPGDMLRLALIVSVKRKQKSF